MFLERPRFPVSKNEIRLRDRAQQIDHLAAICTHINKKTGEQCNANAYFSLRIAQDTNIVRIGGADAYEARCLKHHMLPGKRLVQMELDLSEKQKENLLSLHQ